MRLRILVFESLLALGALELKFVKSLQYKLVYLGSGGRLATRRAGLILLQPRIQACAAVKIVTRGALFGVNSYQKANSACEVLVKWFDSLRWFDSDV